MELLSKLWVRIFVSLLAGGMGAEITHLLTARDINDRSRDNSSPLVLIYGVIAFLALSFYVNKRKGTL